ncbi:MAG TPA: hypothetical protein VEG34_15710, partial [Thermoanaerobaculia bacterium]|nr:hypothetical protein [Thermoanaerobaculia bacterium]
HSFGAGSAYLKAVARADAALGRLAAAAGPETALLVTSDHGVTDRGGHAGPEPEVLTVPVVTAGPGMPRGRLGELRQQDLRFLVREALELPARGFPDEETAVPRVPPPWEGAGWDRGEERRGAFRTGQQVPLVRAGALLAAGLALAAAIVHLGAAWTGRVRGWGPLVLDASFWTALLLLLLGWRGAAQGLVVGALAVGALAVRPASAGTSATRTGTGRRASSPASPYLIIAALAAGVLAGAGRLADGALTSRGALPPGWPGALALLAACALAVAAGRWLGGKISADPPWSALAVGVAAALMPALCARLTGETVSLSTLDVRLAFRLADGPLGLSGAALAATLRAVLPALSLAAGLAWTLRRSDPLVAGRFYAGLGAGLCGQALAAALLLTFRPFDTVGVALATGQLVRLFGEMSFLFLGCATGAVLGRRRAS